MPNQPFEALDESDRVLRCATPVGMEDGIKQIVLRVAGFELHNTRPYHNYETWSDGYMVIGRRDGRAMSREEAAACVLQPNLGPEYVRAEAEDLDAACNEFAVALCEEVQFPTPE